MGLMCKGKFVGLGLEWQFYPCSTHIEGATLQAWNQAEVLHGHQQVAYQAPKMSAGGQISGKTTPLLKEILLSCVVVVMKTETEIKISGQIAFLFCMM